MMGRSEWRSAMVNGRLSALQHQRCAVELLNIRVQPRRSAPTGTDITHAVAGMCASNLTRR